MLLLLSMFSNLLLFFKFNYDEIIFIHLGAEIIGTVVIFIILQIGVVLLKRLLLFPLLFFLLLIS